MTKIEGIVLSSKDDADAGRLLREWYNHRLQAHMVPYGTEQAYAVAFTSEEPKEGLTPRDEVALVLAVGAACVGEQQPDIPVEYGAPLPGALGRAMLHAAEEAARQRVAEPALQ